MHEGHLLAQEVSLLSDLTNKNEIRPFEYATKVELFCQKNYTSLFGNHNKKRPNNLIEKVFGDDE